MIPWVRKKLAEKKNFLAQLREEIALLESNFAEAQLLLFIVLVL